MIGQHRGTSLVILRRKTVPATVYTLPADPGALALAGTATIPTVILSAASGALAGSSTRRPRGG